MSFKEVKMEELNFNPFTKIGTEWMLITAGDEKNFNTMTASWGGMGIMWNKKVITAYILSLIHISCCGTEVKMEVRCPVELAENAVNTVKKIHPYEEPVINVIPLLEF